MSVKVCPGFCVWMTRLSREGDAPDFACGEMGEAALECGFLELGLVTRRVGFPPPARLIRCT
jgi:hypothetical protein